MTIIKNNKLIKSASRITSFLEMGMIDHQSHNLYVSCMYVCMYVYACIYRYDHEIC